jgi:hypothetical protein
VCISQGFPSLPFFVDEDLTRADGVIRCQEVSTADILKFGWRAVRALKIVLELPPPL